MIKYLLFTLSVLLSFNANSQIVYPIYNPADSTFTFNFYQSLDIINIKKEKAILEKEVVILYEMSAQQELIMKKLTEKDSLSRMEIELCDNLNNLLHSKLDNTVKVVDTYKLENQSLKDDLEKANSAIRRERLWKNTYKIGGGILGAGLLFLYLSK